MRRKSAIPIGAPIRLSRLGVPRLSKFNISKVRWRKLRTAWGQVIPEKRRQESNAATKDFLLLVPAEHSLRPLGESIEHIKRWKEGAEYFLAGLTEPGDATSIFYAQYFVQQEFPDLTLDDLHDMVMAYRGACVRATTEASSMAVPGTHRRTWDAWVRRVIDIFEEQGWRATAQKGYGKPSPFVSFFWELQRLIPKKYRRGSTKEALAKEIHLAQCSGPRRTPSSKE